MDVDPTSCAYDRSSTKISLATTSHSFELWFPDSLVEGPKNVAELVSVAGYGFRRVAGVDY